MEGLHKIQHLTQDISVATKRRQCKQHRQQGRSDQACNLQQAGNPQGSNDTRRTLHSPAKILMNIKALQSINNKTDTSQVPSQGSSCAKA